MKKVLQYGLAIVISLGVCVFLFNIVDSYALGDNTNKQQQGQIQGQLQGQAQGQGQVANGVVSVAGDDTDMDASYSWPTNMVAPGVSSATAASPYGSLGIADSEAYVSIPVVIQQINAAIGAGYISETEGKEKIARLLSDLDNSVRPKKLFGLISGRVAQGRHLLNLGGLIAW